MEFDPFNFSGILSLNMLINLLIELFLRIHENNRTCVYMAVSNKTFLSKSINDNVRCVRNQFCLKLCKMNFGLCACVSHTHIIRGSIQPALKCRSDVGGVQRL